MIVQSLSGDADALLDCYNEKTGFSASGGQEAFPGFTGRSRGFGYSMGTQPLRLWLPRTARRRAVMRREHSQFSTQSVTNREEPPSKTENPGVASSILALAICRLRRSA